MMVLFSIGKQFQTAHEKYFADDKVEVLKTYSTILMDMATTFAEIGMGSKKKRRLSVNFLP